VSNGGGDGSTGTGAGGGSGSATGGADLHDTNIASAATVQHATASHLLRVIFINAFS